MYEVGQFTTNDNPFHVPPGTDISYRLLRDGVVGPWQVTQFTAGDFVWELEFATVHIGRCLVDTPPQVEVYGAGIFEIGDTIHVPPNTNLSYRLRANGAIGSWLTVQFTAGDTVWDLGLGDCLLDYGDAPDPLNAIAGEYPTILANNGARHELVPGLYLGATVDAETDGQPHVTANGDDLNGNTPDDEDGITFTGVLVEGNTAAVTVSASDVGKLDAWIDFNQNGNWSDAGDQIFSSQAVNIGNNNLSFTIPVGASLGSTFARFRLSISGGLSPTGLAYTGEVEDYQVSILPDTFPPTVTSTNLLSSYTAGPTSFTITFSENVSTTGGSTGVDSATNPANYLLLEEGVQAGFQTTACNNVDLVNDTQITVNSVSYDDSTFTATINVNGGIALPEGSYRLLVCGTTSIEDLAGNTLAGDGINSGTDFTYNFIVQVAGDDDGNGASQRNRSLPSTGFRMGRITILPPQPASKTYTSTELTLEIPALDVTMPIFGVPVTDGEWDVTWLGNNAGYLYGSAYPTWTGNTVLTGHVWDAWNQPGPFAQLKTLQYGDQFYIHAFGMTYTYEVRDNILLFSKSGIRKAFQHEEYDWVTLLTCEFYNPIVDDYLFRRAVRAVLVSVK